MRKNLSLSAIIALLVTATGVGVASADSPNTWGSDRGDEGSVEVIHLVAKTVQESGFEAEPVLGDQFTFSDDLFRDDEKVGIDGGVGTLVRIDEKAREATGQVVVTFRLDDEGQITAQGLVTFTEDEEENDLIATLAITGGTGEFRAARGEIEVTATDDPDVVRLKIILIR
jgi:allene oxide cyclase-like protein